MNLARVQSSPSPQYVSFFEYVVKNYERFPAEPSMSFEDALREYLIYNSDRKRDRDEHPDRAFCRMISPIVHVGSRYENKRRIFDICDSIIVEDPRATHVMFTFNGVWWKPYTKIENGIAKLPFPFISVLSIYTILEIYFFREIRHKHIKTGKVRRTRMEPSSIGSFEPVTDVDFRFIGGYILHTLDDVIKDFEIPVEGGFVEYFKGIVVLRQG